jgi:hypothetical protein
MSVVARQSFKYSIIGYLGFLLGTVSAIFIFPFDMVFYGKLRFVLSATLMLVPFVVFGLSYSNVYFFGKAKEEGKHQNLFSLSLVGVGINFLIFLLGFFAFFYIFSFNVDPLFNNSVDGLMYIKIADLPESTVKPVMEEFQAELERKHKG